MRIKYRGLAASADWFDLGQCSAKNCLESDPLWRWTKNSQLLPSREVTKARDRGYATTFCGACRDASKELALQALLIDPVVNSAAAAAQLLDELWEINRPYIRRCTG